MSNSLPIAVKIISKLKVLPRYTYLWAVNTFWRVLFWKNMEKQLFFRSAMAGLGKHRVGGYGRIELTLMRPKKSIILS